MEAAVEALLAALDAMDGDPELEPSLGSVRGGDSLSAGGSIDQRRWAQGASDEREEACEDEGAQCDDEGAISYDCVPEYVSHHDQTRIVNNPCTWVPSDVSMGAE
jgi:hypothetical protein